MNSFILDFDGTLVDLNDDPFAVTADADLLRLLEDMLLTTGGAVAICSGRSLENLQRFFCDLPLTLVGCHGAEFYHPEENITIKASSAFLELETVRQQIQTVAGAHSKLIYEDKKFAIAIHDRGSEDEWKNLIDEVVKIIDSKNTIGIFPGKRIIEIKAKEINKATAVQNILAYRQFHGKTPIFIGDDHTDIIAIQYVNSINGITGFVGNCNITASHYFHSPAECRSWLSQFVTDRLTNS